MGEDHPAAAVPLQLQLIESVTEYEEVDGQQIERTRGPSRTYPSLMSFDSKSRYAFHLSPMTFPHEKQRTGMI